jgi:hypothetical protein
MLGLQLPSQLFIGILSFAEIIFHFYFFSYKRKRESGLRRNGMAIHHHGMGVQIYHHREYAGSLDTASCTSHLFCKLGVSSDFWSDGIFRGLWRNQFLERE